MTYSQNNEQEIILSYFGSKVGRFVEIGAYHPIVLSNTRALVERDWQGKYIEANQKHYEHFKSFYQNMNWIECIHAALSNDDKPVIFYPCDDAVSTTSIEHKIKWETTVPFKEPVIVPAYTIEQLEKETMGYDFLTLDTEGTSYALFSQMSNNYIDSLKLVCIEHDGHLKDINTRLSRLGFKNLLVNGENVIYGK